MPKNIVIFSDGTGQRGGVLVDENRSNIYKLYRAARCGPENAIDPKQQRTFYDPGIGTLPPGGGFFSRTWRWVYNLASQALGLGLTRNIIDCYAAIIRVWRPGDRIFLFGFSRGAYTIRCLGGVIAMCGVPDEGKGQTPLRLDEAASKRIAREAVKTVYQHTSSWDSERATERQTELLSQRRERARRFRHTYGSGDDDGPNTYPHFIGVFDTVASLVNPLAATVFAVGGLVLAGLVASGLWYVLSPLHDFASWLIWCGGAVTAAVIGGYAFNFALRFRSEIDLPRKAGWRFFHLTEMRMNFYDTNLNPNVKYARHALSIDEARGSFKRVRWGDPKEWRKTGVNERGERDLIWFEQLWFAGNHSDIGGSYPEEESRLSDISLSWMVDAARKVGLLVDERYLNLYPDWTGPQHDETRSSRVFRLAPKAPRRIGPDFPLHDSVIKRFEAGKVLLYDRYDEYRPENLKEHKEAKRFYR